MMLTPKDPSEHDGDAGVVAEARDVLVVLIVGVLKHL
jgi:hypothetical protein